MNNQKVKWGCALISLCFLFVVILIIIAGPPPAGEKPMANATPAKTATLKPVPAPPSPREVARDELMTVMRQASMATNSCRFAIDDTIHLLSTADADPENLMKAYSKAHLAEPDCTDSVDDLGQIGRLKLATPVMTRNLDFALDECARAAKLRAQALKTVKVALDGDYSFATAQKFKDAQQEARTTHNLCMGSLKEIGLESGLPADELDFLDP